MCLGGFGYLEKAAYDSTFNVSSLERESAYRRLNPPTTTFILPTEQLNKQPTQEISREEIITRGLMTRQEVVAFETCFGNHE